MRRIYLFACVLLLLSATVFSQAYETHTDYNKKKQKAIAIECGYPQEAVENAIIQKIKGMGNKSREEKGMFNRDKGSIVFRNASVTDISDRDMDYIIKVERKSRREKDMTMLYLVINKNGEDVLSTDETYADRAKSFLNDLIPDIEGANLDLDIKAQEEELEKSENKFKDLKEDQESMEKKIKSLEDDLKKNARNQEDQQKQIETQRQLLEVLKAKRR